MAAVPDDNSGSWTLRMTDFCPSMKLTREQAAKAGVEGEK